MTRLGSFIVVAVVAVFIFLPAVDAQDAVARAQRQEAAEVAAKKAFEADLLMRKQTLITQSEDLESIMKPLGGQDLDDANAIDARAAQGVTYLDASYWFLGIYDRMQCDGDKNVAKAVVGSRLRFYAHLLDMAVGQTNEFLGLARVPAVAQQGAQIRDELRADEVKLDEIAASLR